MPNLALPSWSAWVCFAGRVNDLGAIGVPFLSRYKLTVFGFCDSYVVVFWVFLCFYFGIFSNLFFSSFFVRCFLGGIIFTRMYLVACGTMWYTSHRRRRWHGTYASWTGHMRSGTGYRTVLLPEVTSPRGGGVQPRRPWGHPVFFSSVLGTTPSLLSVLPQPMPIPHLPANRSFRHPGVTVLCSPLFYIGLPPPPRSPCPISTPPRGGGRIFCHPGRGLVGGWRQGRGEKSTFFNGCFIHSIVFWAFSFPPT